MSTTTAHPSVAAALEAAAGLSRVAWDQLEAGEVLATAAALARLRALVDGALVAVTERVEATGAADAAGWASTKDLITHLLGGRKGTGGGLVRIAERTRQLPAVRAALSAGEVSLAQASAITTRVATLPRAPELREQAAGLMLALVAEHSYDATDLDRAFPNVVRELDPDGRLLGADQNKDLQERGAHHARFLSFSPDTLGGVRIKGYATLEETELVKACLMPLAAPVTTTPGACGASPVRGRDPHTGRRVGHGCPDPDCFHDGKDPRDHGTRLWDALVAACTRLQATNTLPHAHGASTRLVVTLSLDDLRASLDTTGSIQGEGLLPSGSGSPRPRSADSPVRPRSSPPSSARTVRSSTSAAPAAWSPPASGTPWSYATSTAPSPAAPASQSPATPTTSTTGPTADQPAWTTSSCSEPDPVLRTRVVG